MATVIRNGANVRDDFPRTEAAEICPFEGQFLNRELSLLQFHGRVLEEAIDNTNPLLERLKFLSIFSSNLDEFFMIRISGLKEEHEHEISMLSLDGMTPTDQLSKIRPQVEMLVSEASRCLLEDILPRLKESGLELASYEALTSLEKESLDDYFMEKIFPILTPLAVDPSHPFPYISPLSLNLGLMVEAPQEGLFVAGANQSEPRFVRIKVPSVVPRLVPVGLSGAKFVLLEEIIEANTQSLFPGMIPGPSYRFRVTRDADIEVREEEAQDLLREIQEELRRRRFGAPVRLEVSPDMPVEIIGYLTRSLALETNDVFVVDGPLGVQDLMSLYDCDRPDLKDVPFEPATPSWFHEHKLMFDAIKERDRLLHHPYDSYDCVTEFIDQAVADQDVVAIKICLYRTGPDSPIPPASQL